MPDWRLRASTRRRRRITGKSLRRTQTPAERRAWTLLRARRMLGLKWRRQHPIGPFVVDFCCAEARVIVEIDGSVHLKPDKAAYDNARTAWLEAQGWRVLRIRNNDIDRDRLRAIIEPMTRRMRPPSPHRGEGERG